MGRVRYWCRGNVVVSLPVDRLALEELEAALPALRPELHRYTARMTGSIIDGEDVLHDVLAAATQAIRTGTEPENLRAWLFRIAHNTAVNYVRRRAREVPMSNTLPEYPAAPQPASLDDSLRAFVPLTPQQRSAVILRDVLSYTAAEVATLTDSTVSQVKSSLHRGRASLRRDPETPPTLGDADRMRLTRYTELFNAQDFDQLRELLVSEAKLEVVGRERRAGSKAVGGYFTNYAAVTDWWLAPGVVEGRPCALVYNRTDPNGAPRYLIVLGFAGEAIADIRDFRYAPYIMNDAAWQRLT